MGQFKHCKANLVLSSSFVLLQEAEQREREDRRRRIEEHTCQVAEAERRRKQRTKMLRKRTHQGQPVMRYRMDKILGQLQAEAGQH